MKKDITVLINSTDSFADCWEPFFTLFTHYWSECKYPVVLNTETKLFDYPSLRLKCSQVGLQEISRRLTWSECLIKCLDEIDTQAILYLQEDYFLNDFVRQDKVAYFCNLLLTHDLDCIRLMELSGSGPWIPTENSELWQIDNLRSRYVVGLQAGLWRRSTLRRLLRRHETPWQFETYGSKRARRHGCKVYCVNRDLYSKRGEQVIPYIPTGVMHGHWNKEVVEDLFAKHRISVDFTVRGFYKREKNRRPKPPIWKRLVTRFRSFF